MAHSAILNWVASVDVIDGYNVYRRDTASGVPTKLNTALVSGTTFTDTTIGVGDYFYFVRSSKDGIESVDSNQATAVVLPAPPTNLVVSVT